MEVMMLLVRLFLVGIFALAGIGKLLDLPGSEKAVKDFGVPEDLAREAFALAAQKLPVKTKFVNRADLEGGVV